MASTEDRGTQGRDDSGRYRAGPSGRARSLLAAGALAGLVIALALPVILSGRLGTSESGDELHYHLPVIREFATAWPEVDLKHYNSATTPGYHLFMALVWNATGDPAAPTPRAPMQAGPGGMPLETTITPDERAALREFQREVLPMRLLNLAFGVGAALVVWGGARRCVGPWMAVMLSAPFALCPYIVSSSMWLTTDNAAWMFVLGALALAWGAKPGVGGVAGAGVLACLAVLTRQIHVWVAGPIGLAGLLASPLGALAPRAWRRSQTNAKGGWGVLLAAFLAAVAPLAIVGAFAWAWGGLTPIAPRIRSIHAGGVNPAAPAFALSALACYGAFFLPLIRLREPGARLLTRSVWTAALLGLAAALAVPTSTQVPTFEFPPLRGYGWLWAVSAKFPTISDRSLLFGLLAPCGGGALVLLWRAARANQRGGQAAVLMVGLLAWLCAQSTNPAAWQRYFDPVLLASLAWLSAMGVVATPANRPSLVRVARFAPLVLALGMLALAARSIVPDLRRNLLPFDGGAPGVSETRGGSDAQRALTGARPTE